ncbi:MAG TPA: TIGR03013 family XrtA/PEP-CTERM system glycosyltransferase [Burkholderiales bacterium]|nr:TIGR03013 family XrtA/PEP-CTERM system glycosyltransferase [Burkholderiales bacterium]
MIRLFSHYVPTNLLLLFGLEAMVFVASIYGGAAIRFYDPVGDFYLLPTDLPLQAFSFALVMLGVMAAVGLYSADLPDGAMGMMVRLVIAFLVGLGVMTLIFYLLPNLYLGRGAFGLSWFIAFGAVICLRLAFFRWTRLGIFERRILVLGTGTRAVNVDLLARRTHFGTNLNIVGFLPLLATQHHVQPSRILSEEASLLAAVRKHVVTEIIIAVRERRGGGLPMQELLECKLTGVKVTELSSFYERERGQLRIDSMNASWLVFGDGFRQDTIREIVKRAFDVVASLMLLLMTLPFTIVTALLILMEDGAPIFYRQQRVGQGGRPFDILKFRSMKKDAEKDGKPRWASAQDDRTTRVGRVIRKLRIDELPQIFNVLRGEMSFVGPRPERPFFVSELAKEIPYYNARHSIKPGITGWAQVRYPYGASLEDAIEKLQYDLYYVKNHTLFLDIMILFETVQVVLWGKGAR